MEPRDKGSSRGLLFVLGATAVAGASGYLIQLLAPRLLTDTDAYLSFSVFWSTIYLLGSAVGGIQQEVARATRPALSTDPHSRLAGFIWGAIAIVVVVSIGVGLAVAPVAFGGSTGGMTAALVVGLTGYALTSIVTGLFYGLQRLNDVAALIVVDAVLRAVAVTLCLAVGAPADAVALAIAAPFGLSVAIVWTVARRRVGRAYTVSATPRQLAVNAGHTVLAAASTGVMVTGMPLLFRVALTDATLTAVAALTLLVTLSRAPFIIPLMALQSYLTVLFRDDPGRAPARIWRYLAFAAAAAALAAVFAWFAVPWLIEVISGGAYQVTALMSAIVVVSAVLVGCLCITGPALLARARHRLYSAGWVVAALVTLLLLFQPWGSADARAVSALVLAPIVGLAVHLIALRRTPLVASFAGSATERE